MRITPDQFYDDVIMHASRAYLVTVVIFSIVLLILFPLIGIFLVAFNVSYFSFMYMVESSRNRYFEMNPTQVLSLEREGLIERLDEIEEILEMIDEDKDDPDNENEDFF